MRREKKGKSVRGKANPKDIIARDGRGKNPKKDKEVPQTFIREASDERGLGRGDIQENSMGESLRGKEITERGLGGKALRDIVRRQPPEKRGRNAFSLPSPSPKG